LSAHINELDETIAIVYSSLLLIFRTPSAT